MCIIQFHYEDHDKENKITIIIEAATRPVHVHVKKLNTIRFNLINGCLHWGNKTKPPTAVHSSTILRLECIDWPLLGSDATYRAIITWSGPGRGHMMDAHCTMENLKGWGGGHSFLKLNKHFCGHLAFLTMMRVFETYISSNINWERHQEPLGKNGEKASEEHAGSVRLVSHSAFTSHCLWLVSSSEFAQ